MNAGAAQRLLVNVLAGAALHHRRAGHEQLGGALDQDRQVRRAQPGRTEAGDRAEAGRDHRDDRQVVDDVVPAGVHRHVGVAGLLERLDAAAAAGPFDQPDDRQPEFVRQLLGSRSACAMMPASAAPPRMVKSSPPTTTLRPAMPPGAGDEVGRHEAGQLARIVISSRSGQRADLTERALVEQGRDPLADGEPPGVMLPPDLLRTAHRSARLLPPAQLVQFRLPCHADKS